jgi:hypothetical protein
MTIASARRATVAWLDSRQAARVVQVIAGLALLLSVWFGVQQYRLTACQATYAEASNASQRARAQAAEVDRAAQDALFVTVAEEPRNAIAAIRAYNAQRAEADRQRAASPIPPPPSTNCG